MNNRNPDTTLKIAYRDPKDADFRKNGKFERGSSISYKTLTTGLNEKGAHLQLNVNNEIRKFYSGEESLEQTTHRNHR